MNLKYKILRMNPNQHTIVVRYYTDICTEEFLSNLFNEDNSVKRDETGQVLACCTDTNLALWTVPPITGQELEDYIIKSAPVAWFKLQEQIQNPDIDTSMTSISPLLNIEKTVIVIDSPILKNTP